MGTLVAAMDHSGMDVSHLRHRSGKFLGLLRTRMGRLVVLGSGGKRFIYALAGGHGTHTFPGRHGKAWWVQKLDGAPGNYSVFAESVRNLSGAFWCVDVCPCLCHRSKARNFHFSFSCLRDRRFTSAVCVESKTR